MSGPRNANSFHLGRELDALSREINKLKAAVALADYATNENEAARQRQMQLYDRPPVSDLNYVYERPFEELRQISDRRSLMLEWLKLAALGAVFAIYEYHESIESLIQAGERYCPEVDFQAERANFEQVFPHWKNARNAIAHTAEILREPEQHAYRGAIKEGFFTKPANAHITFGQSFEGRTLIMSRKGVLIKLAIDGSTVEKLLGIHARFEALVAGSG